MIPPTQIGNDSNWVQIAGGSGHCMALKSNGTLWGWGYNTTGQVGVNSTTNVLAPTQVGNDSNWAKVFCGDAHTLALKTDGTLWAWGTNNYGQVGNGNTVNQLVPVLIDSIHTWIAIAGGASHTLALTSNGELFVCGYNGYGALGNGTTTSSSSFIQINSASTYSAVGAGWYFSQAIKSDGTDWGWGKNNYGQTGTGTSGANVLTPGSVASAGCLPTQVQTLTQEGLSIHPNPVHSGQSIQIETSEEINEILVYNISGQLALHQQGHKNKVQTNSLGSGMYIVQVVKGKAVYTQRVVLN